MNSNHTQNQRIIEYMQEHGSITQLEALKELGVMRLASRISDLRKQGYNIVRSAITVKNRFDEPCRIAKYVMKED